MSRPRTAAPKPRKPSDLVVTSLRIEERLRKQLATAAKQNGRSFNSEASLRLTASLARP